MYIKMALLVLSFQFFLVSLVAEENTKLLDKVLADINGTPITLSDVGNIEKNYTARRKISPILYTESSPSRDFLITYLINVQIIRKHLSDFGYVITDDNVKEEIKNTQKNFNISEEQLKAYLKQNGLSYDIYFDIMKQSIERNMFIAKTIVPRINISEQQVKNYFYELNKNDKTLSFEYNLTDYILPVDSKTISSIEEKILKYKTSNIKDESLNILSTIDQTGIKEDDLNKEIVQKLRTQKEGEITSCTVIKSECHYFYINKKELVESDAFLKIKEELRRELMEKEISKLTETWIEKEKEKHHINIKM